MVNKNWVVSVAFLLMLFSIGIVSALPNIDVQKIDKSSVIISEIGNPAKYDLIIDNHGAKENYEVFTFSAVTLTPDKFFELPVGESRVQITATPEQSLLDRVGFITFEYELRGTNSGSYKDKLLFKLVKFKDVFDISSKSLNPSTDNTVFITVRNKENLELNDVKLGLSSRFFDTNQVISFKPYEVKNISVPVDFSKVQDVLSSTYVVTATFAIGNASTRLETTMNYLERSGMSTTSKVEGLLIKTLTVTKSNEGNIPTTATISQSTNILSRLFTSSNPLPNSINRKGLLVTYTWEKDLAPGESFTINSTTNYVYPLLIIILLIVIVYLVRWYAQTALVLKKQVSFVKTKGGEFALKVTIRIKARSHLDNIQIIDRLPMMAKLYEQYGRSPDRIDEASKRLFWNIERLNAGEERVISYVIYSKLKVVGRFELPAATAVYEKAGKIEETWSNKTYFATETRDSSKK